MIGGRAYILKNVRHARPASGLLARSRRRAIGSRPSPNWRGAGLLKAGARRAFFCCSAGVNREALMAVVRIGPQGQRRPAMNVACSTSPSEIRARLVRSYFAEPVRFDTHI